MSTGPFTVQPGPSYSTLAEHWEAALPGNAKLTKGFRLPSKYVVHAVGPVWQGGRQRSEPALLASCYRRALDLATLVDAKTIAFPCISTALYGYPFNQAARIADGPKCGRTSEKTESSGSRFLLFLGQGPRRVRGVVAIA